MLLLILIYKLKRVVGTSIFWSYRVFQDFHAIHLYQFNLKKTVKLFIFSK